MEAATVTGNRSRQRQAGFTYIGMLIAVAVMGVWLAATSNVLHQSLRRDKESELLFIGHQFRAALDRYA
jgi:type II secretory pathway pseudopilin PulG